MRALVMAAMLMGSVMSFAQEKPPSIAYGGSRSSEKWIDIGGTSVAVDEGITWKGLTAWLSLDWELVVTDDKTGKAVWSADVGAFWNEITFAEVDALPGGKTWAVELRPGPGVKKGAEKRQYHHLTTGKQLNVAGDVEAVSGEPLTPAAKWSGRMSNLATPLRLVIGTEEDWRTCILKPMFEGRDDAPKFGAIDFTKHRVLVISEGEIANCAGIDARVWADGARILVHLGHQWFQTEGPDGGAQTVRPFGIFLLPRSPSLIVVERNTQNLKRGPALWKEELRVDGVSRKMQKHADDK